MGWTSTIIAISLQLTVSKLYGDDGRISRKHVPLYKTHSAEWRQTYSPILGKPSIVCYCSPQLVLELKRKNLFLRSRVTKLRYKPISPRRTPRSFIYSPECCKIDLSNPNKLYTYPLTIRLTDQEFSESLTDPSSTAYKNLASKVINGINQLFSNDSPLVSVEVTSFRPGSVLCDLALVVKGLISQSMYETLKLAIEAGELGGLNVGVFVPDKNPNTMSTPTPEETTSEPETGSMTPESTTRAPTLPIATEEPTSVPNVGSTIPEVATLAPETGVTLPEETVPTMTPEVPTTATEAGVTVPEEGTTSPTVTVAPEGATGPISSLPSESSRIGEALMPAFEHECLCSHNLKRMAHGTPNMTWSADIATSAQVWANQIASKDKMDHDPGNSLYGENIYRAWGDLEATKTGLCQSAVNVWYDEIKKYDFNLPGFSMTTGHFTQVVWKESTKLGVGEAISSSRKRYVVARYQERGNVLGNFAENVPRPLNGESVGPTEVCVGGGGGATAEQESPGRVGSPTGTTEGSPEEAISPTPGNIPTTPVTGGETENVGTPTATSIPRPGGMTPYQPTEQATTVASSGRVTASETETTISPSGIASTGQTSPQGPEGGTVTPTSPMVTFNPTFEGVTPAPPITEGGTPNEPQVNVTPNLGTGIATGITTIPIMTVNPAQAGLTSTPAMTAIQITSTEGLKIPALETSVTPSPNTPERPTRIPPGETSTEITQGVAITPTVSGITNSQSSANEPATAESGEKPSEPTDFRPSIPYNPETPGKIFKVVIQILEIIFNEKLANPASNQFHQLKDAIEQAIMDVFEVNNSFESVTTMGFREKVKNRVTKAKKVRVPILRAAESPGVDAEFELSFRDNKPNQLAALENQLSTGYLGNLKVLPSISAIIIDLPGICTGMCMEPVICYPQCPKNCCSSKSVSSCPSTCPKACAPRCTPACCMLKR